MQKMTALRRIWPMAGLVAGAVLALAASAAQAGDGGFHRAGYYGDYDRYDYDRHRVCDSDGDRCYLTRSAYWSYREYYRRHGYSWNGDYRDPEHREVERLNRDEYERHRYDRDYDDGYARYGDRY